MSNRISLWSTTFVDSGSETYGFRVADDYDKEYYNDFPSPVKGDMEVLRLAVGLSEFSQFRDFLIEGECGMSINDNWYDWEDIEKILKEME